MDKYLVLRESTPVAIQDSMNLCVEKGYILRDFVIDSRPLQPYIAVMELVAPKRIPPLDAVSG